MEPDKALKTVNYTRETTEEKTNCGLVVHIRETFVFDDGSVWIRYSDNSRCSTPRWKCEYQPELIIGGK